ncbi:MAG: hypothetical protein KF858_14000 [Candidatus Sumerlaeia bacterium]|nr:hypothetical protein [Candidatus Sumerlaeia bacterium]
MAVADVVGIHASWQDLRANPIFRRAMVPRGMRVLLRSPMPRALGLTLIAVWLFETMSRSFLSFWPVIAGALVFWFLIHAMQRVFCWIELSSLTATGTLDDYLNSGMTRADVAIGVIYPAEISERVAVAAVLLWFLLSTDSTTIRVVLVLFMAIHLMALFRPPFLYLPDAESYLRKRNPLTLAFVALAVVVPLAIWFGLYFGLLFGIAIGSSLLGLALGTDNVFLLSILGTWFLSRWPLRWWQTWRLKRFYSRYGSLDDLFERYIEQG